MSNFFAAILFVVSVSAGHPFQHLIDKAHKDIAVKHRAFTQQYRLSVDRQKHEAHQVAKQLQGAEHELAKVAHKQAKNLAKVAKENAAVTISSAVPAIETAKAQYLQQKENHLNMLKTEVKQTVAQLSAKESKLVQSMKNEKTLHHLEKEALHLQHKAQATLESTHEQVRKIQKEAKVSGQALVKAGVAPNHKKVVAESHALLGAAGKALEKANGLTASATYLVKEAQNSPANAAAINHLKAEIATVHSEVVTGKKEIPQSVHHAVKDAKKLLQQENKVIEHHQAKAATEKTLHHLQKEAVQLQQKVQVALAHNSHKEAAAQIKAIVAGDKLSELGVAPHNKISHKSKTTQETFRAFQHVESLGNSATELVKEAQKAPATPAAVKNLKTQIAELHSKVEVGEKDLHKDVNAVDKDAEKVFHHESKILRKVEDPHESGVAVVVPTVAVFLGLVGLFL